MLAEAWQDRSCPTDAGLRRFASHVASLLDRLSKRRGTCSPDVAGHVGALRRRHAALKRLIGGDVQLRFFSREILDACWKATDEVNAVISGIPIPENCFFQR